MKMKPSKKQLQKELDAVAFDLSVASSRLSQINHMLTSRTDPKIRKSIRKIELDCIGHSAFIARVSMVEINK